MLAGICLLAGGLAVGGFLYAPRSARDRINGNESRVLAVLKNLGSAQSQFRQAVVRDENRNGAGEFGDFHELSNSRPPLLAADFAAGTPTRVVIHGYVLQIHLAADAGTREERYRVYAWPESFDSSGRRVFMVSETGDVVTSKNRGTRYSGDEVSPHMDAAFRQDPGHPGACVAGNGVGADGELWIFS